MAMTGILRPGHVQLRVMELGPALHHYKEMVGLIETARDAEGRVYLKAWDEHDLFSIVLRERTARAWIFTASRCWTPRPWNTTPSA